MESGEEETPMHPSEELEHLALAARLSGVDVDIVLPESKEMTREGMRLHYLDWGTAGRPPIVFLHGGGLNAHTWDIVCLMLRRDYRCVALDQRGHGDSEWEPTADYSFESQIRDIEGFVERLGFEQSLLIGHSMGGFAAMGYAMRHA